MIIVGLGNPSKEYENTFHNLGFMAIDMIADKLNKKLKTAECSSVTSVFSVLGEKIVLAKPMTYMNLSGVAVKSLLAKYKQTNEDLIVIYDDFDIQRYSLRARVSGSAGTHNGMRDIVAKLASTDFKRIRIGIGSTETEKKDYVLSSLSKEDIVGFKEPLNNLSDAVLMYLKNKDFDMLMRALN